MTEKKCSAQNVTDVSFFCSVCDVLKKKILNMNPRKESIAFERKLNADGTYWKPEQYPKTSWVAERDLQLIHPIYLALHVNLHVLLMSQLTPTISYSKKPEW